MFISININQEEASTCHDNRSHRTIRKKHIRYQMLASFHLSLPSHPPSLLSILYLKTVSYVNQASLMWLNMICSHGWLWTSLPPASITQVLVLQASLPHSVFAFLKKRFYLVIYLLMSMSILPVCISMYCLCAQWMQKSEGGIRSHRTGVPGGHEPPCGKWERNWGREQKALLTAKSSLQLHIFIHFF